MEKDTAVFELIESHHKVSPWGSTLRPLWNWAQHHPGAVTIGALLLAAMLAVPAARKTPPPVDLAAEDVPLFV